MIKALGVIFLSIWLILVGLIGIAGMTLSVVAGDVVHLIGIVAGVLMLVTLRYCHSCHHDEVGMK